MGYADDTYMMDSQIAHMVEGLRATETFLQRTDQAVNPKKSLHAMIGSRPSECVHICGDAIPQLYTFKSLGVPISLRRYGDTSVLVRNRIEKAISMAKKIGTLTLGY